MWKRCKARTKPSRISVSMDCRPLAQKVDLLHATHLDEAALAKFSEQPFAKALRERVAEFKGVPARRIAAESQCRIASLPERKASISFAISLRVKLGGILADDMGLGKTLQTLSWLAWLRQRARRKIESPRS